MHSPWTRAYVAGALLLCATAFLLVPRTPSVSASARAVLEGVGSFDELQARFESLADTYGARYAFTVLGEAAIPPNTDLHLLGHTVGDRLYAQEGVSGITYCTNEFRNACSHSIVIGALKEFGEAALPEIRESCKKAPGGPGAYTMCFHGLGHGVFSANGYELAETASFCEKTGTDAYKSREYVECVGGAIMELMGTGGHDPQGLKDAQERYLSLRAPLAPCLSAAVPPIAREICLTYLTPHLWQVAGIDLGHPNPEKFGEAFSLCERIPQEQQSLRDACFGGFGKEFVPIAAGRDIRAVDSMREDALSDVHAWCRSASPLDGQRACVREALNSLFWGGENNPEASFLFCTLADAHRVACEEQLARNIRQYVRDVASRQALCERLVEPVRPWCSDI